MQAASINQDGVIRVPLGALTLGGDGSLQVIDDTTSNVFAPPTTSLTIAPGSITSVSTDGLVIPYGTTTDQIEWFFAPTSANALTAPPAGVLHLGGANVNVMAGSTVDLKGGGDVYAYEFIPGTGGSRDVLDQFNTDTFSTNNGYQYPDHRQVYAIVPGLSNAAVAAFDPIYAANYANLYGPSQVGMRVFLSAAPGLAAGWYTLLPAQYALLPGGMRVVQDTGASTPPPVSAAQLSDGTDVVSGYFGVAGTNSTRAPTPVVFDVQSAGGGPQGVRHRAHLRQSDLRRRRRARRRGHTAAAHRRRQADPDAGDQSAPSMASSQPRLPPAAGAPRSISAARAWTSSRQPGR